MISVKSLTKYYYNDIPAVNKVSFEIKKGEIIGLLGPNAAGKTTIMKILTGYLYPNSGEVSIGDMNIYEDPIKIKKMIGYLPETAPLYQDVTVEEYLDFIADIRGIDVSKKEERCNEMIKACDLQDVYYSNISELSKGFRQRVGLASAMMHDPDILILDEPTSGLDPLQIMEFRKLLRRLGEEKTIILSTHILQEVAATCERIIIIHKGKKIADDTQKNLLDSCSDDKYMLFTIEAEENWNKIEQDIAKLKGIWELEFRRRIGENQLEFKAFLKQDNSFKNELKSYLSENNWKLIDSDVIPADLEEVFLKFTKGGLK